MQFKKISSAQSKMIQTQSETKAARTHEAQEF